MMVSDDRAVDELEQRAAHGGDHRALLTGTTAPTAVKRRMSIALALQVVVALAGAIVGVVGLGKNDLNALAFGTLVPMFGIGMNGAWAARYGSYGPRAKTTKPSRRNE